MMDDGVKAEKENRTKNSHGTHTHTHSILAPLLYHILSTEWWLFLRFFMYLTWLCPGNQLSMVES
jgi:hypothetical protein